MDEKELEKVNGGANANDENGTVKTMRCNCGNEFNIDDNLVTEGKGCYKDTYAKCPKCGRTYRV